MTPTTFHDPRFHMAIDVPAQVALLPPRATCKGMFFNDVIARAAAVDASVDLFARAGVARREYTAFLDYPHAEWMRLAEAAAVVVARGGRAGEGLRELGRHAYDAIFDHALGKVLFGPLGFDVDRVVANTGLGYRLGLSFGRVTVTPVGPQHARVTYRDFPSFLETYNVGVIEGGILRYGATPRVQIALDGLAHAELDVRW